MALFKNLCGGVVKFFGEGVFELFEPSKVLKGVQGRGLERFGRVLERFVMLIFYLRVPLLARLCLSRLEPRKWLK